MRPEVAYDPVSQRLTVGLAAVAAKDEGPALARVLDGVERLAAARRHPTAIILDEFRQMEERFRSLGGVVEAVALERIMSVAEDVPYNVQRLAHECWERLRVAPRAPLTEAGVDEALDAIVRSEHASYARLWVRLTRAQRIALKAVIEERGRELTSSGVLRRHGLGSSTMQKALRALEAGEMIRLDEAPEGRTWRLEDPFFAAWLRAAQTR